MYIKNTLRTHALAHTQVLVLLAITLSLSSLVHFTTSHTDMLGLAWDLGAVTTGPVTVPLVIALGMGVAGSGGNASPLTGFFFLWNMCLCVCSQSITCGLICLLMPFYTRRVWSGYPGLTDTRQPRNPPKPLLICVHNMWPYMSPYLLLHTQGLEW